MSIEGAEEGNDDKTFSVSNVIKEFKILKEKLKSEDEEGVSTFESLDKTVVLQECRAFNNPTVVTEEPHRCCQLITKLLKIVQSGDDQRTNIKDTLTSSETTDVFFGVTKLFQSEDYNLRRMIYLFIKETAQRCNRDDVIIVTSSLTKDMNSKNDLYRANSIRVLVHIIDNSMLSAIERYLKQAIVDKNPFVSSSALIASSHLMQMSPDVVRRWINEVQEALNSSNDMVQFHALCLLYQIKSHDKLAISKMVAQLMKNSSRSPFAMCVLIRYISSMLREDLSNAQSAYRFLESALRNPNEMVVYEAARAICFFPAIESSDLNPALTVLQLYLSSPKSSLRFAAMRTLSQLALQHPSAVAKCNEEVEVLLTDSNRSIATLAITTLLKTGSESGVDRLIKQISTFITDIPDEFKVIVVQSIKDLCLKYRNKHRILIGFLATFLREEGGFEFKKAITDSIIELIQQIPETKESSLFHLCEFIEDCEFVSLSTQILHLIGELGPTTVAPPRYIRFIYNRVILENAITRAAAVSSLTKFAVAVPSIAPSIIVLLKRCTLDHDNEVRDRATIAIKALEKLNEDSDMNQASTILLEGLPISFSSLERSLNMYKYQFQSTKGQPLTFSSLPIIEETKAENGANTTNKSTLSKSEQFSPQNTGHRSEDERIVELLKIPEISDFGRIFRSSLPIGLTESETEYVVSAVKHIFDEHLVLEFRITNTIPDQILKDVFVKLDPIDETEELYSIQNVISINELRYNTSRSCYTILRRTLGIPISPASFNCELQFRVLDVDLSTGQAQIGDEGIAEEYPLEDLEIVTADFMAKVSYGEFRRCWEQMSNSNEVLEKFALQMRKLEEAVPAVINFLGMQPCDGTGNIDSTSTNAKKGLHNMNLSGAFVGNIPVLVRAQIQLDESAGVVLKIAVRSENRDISQNVADCIR